MPTFKFSKLVRDNIVEQQIATGATPHYYQLDPEAHKKELIKKIIEEAREIGDAPSSEVAGEIADVQQALDDLCKLYGVSKVEVSAAKARKAATKGAFSKGLYIDSIMINEADEWTRYYRAHPGRYPEVYTMKPKTYSAGGIVINTEGSVLLVQEYGYYWGLPRGHIEEQEQPLDAAIREIAEESGLHTLKLVKELGAYERYRFDKNGNDITSELKHITFFLFTTTAQTLQPHDSSITAAQWVAPHKVAECLIHPKDIEFYQNQLSTITKLMLKK